MKYLILALVLISGTGNAFAQKKNPETYGKSITATDLRNHLYIVAGPGMEGRETATEGQRKAAAYLVSQFRALGLEPANNGSYEQVFHVHQDSLTDAKVEVNGTTFQINQDFLPGFSSNISGTFRFSEVVIAGTKSLDSLKTASLGGKLVMVFGTPQGGRGQQGGNIFTTLQQKGVAGILVVQSNFPRMLPVSRRGNQTMSLFKRMIAPQQYMVSETIARAIVGSAFDSVKANETGVMTFPANVLLETQKITTTLQSTNVMAMVPGTDKKDEYLFITAHYDHLGKRGDSIIYYGADDDGSGTVSLLEIAEGFMKAKAAGRGPRRTIVFMAVSGEEKGLWGSDYYSSHPVFPLEKTTVNLNIDMIGRIDPKRTQGDSLNYVYVIGDDKMSSDLRPISEMVNKKYARLELDYKYNGNDPERFFYRSDHYNFAKKGVPIIFYFNGTHADYHRATDTPDKINYELMAKRARLVFYTAWEMANRDALLKRDIPLDTSVFTR